MRHAHSPPTARTWIGNHGNNNITNSNNWSPAGQIGPADTLTMTAGTMNISGTQLPPTDELSVSGNSVVNVANGRGEQFAASDNATINLTNSSGILVHNLVGDITINTLGQNELHVQTPGRSSSGSVTINNNGSLLEGGKLDGAMAFPGKIRQAFTNWRAGFPDSIDGKPVWAVQANGKNGLIATLYFDKQTGLLTRYVRHVNTADGRLPNQVDYSDYRPVAGVMMPFKFSYIWISGREEYTIDSYQPNVAIQM